MAWLARGLPLASRGVIDLAHARTSPSLMKPSRHSSALLALALAAPALTGCIQTPRPDPALDVPKVFGNAPGDRAAAPPRADWWKSFGSAELTRMVQTAEAENLDIAAAVARIQQADAQAKIAGSALLPVVDLSASTARSRSADLSGRGGTNGSNRFGSSLSASYELDFWGKNQSIRAAADQNALATRFDRDTVALTALATTATTYVRILAAQGPPPYRQPEPAERDPRAHHHPRAARGRHRHVARSGAAGERGRQP